MEVKLDTASRVGPAVGQWVFSVIALAMVGFGAGLALWLEPQPHSDWLYYWTAAGDPARYERGGLGLWMLALPKAAGLGPVATSLSLNLASACLSLWMGWRSDQTRWRCLALLIASYLMLITPFFGVVQLDLLAAAMLGAACCLVLQTTGAKRVLEMGLAIALTAVAVSTKPQYALTLWMLLGLLVLACLLWDKRSEGMKALLLVLLTGSMLGFGIDNGLRSFSGRTQAIRTNSAVTLYGGLLVSRIEGCGYWSVEAAEAAKADLHKPLAIAVRDRLMAKPLSHWISIIRCKLPQIVRPPPYALYWLVESPNIRARIDADPDRDEIEARYRRALDLERRVYGYLTILIPLACITSSVLTWRRGERVLALLPSLWIVSFWMVHLVFEIQGRYFLGMFLIAPMLCALALRACPSRTANSVISQG